MGVYEYLSDPLKEGLELLPDGFNGTFDDRGRRSVVLGLLAKSIWAIPEVNIVGLEHDLSTNGMTFRPDVVGFESLEPLRPVVFVDYETSKTSDARVLKTDIASYRNWCAANEKRIPYFIVTTLPDREAPDWKLLDTGKDGLNSAVAGRLEDVRRNPFRFWYAEYIRSFDRTTMQDILFLNISDNHLQLIGPDRRSGNDRREQDRREGPDCQEEGTKAL